MRYENCRDHFSLSCLAPHLQSYIINGWASRLGSSNEADVVGNIVRSAVDANAQSSRLELQFLWGAVSAPPVGLRCVFVTQSTLNHPAELHLLLPKAVNE